MELSQFDIEAIRGESWDDVQELLDWARSQVTAWDKASAERYDARGEVR